MRILVVEESGREQSVLEAALKEAGHSVDVADDGEIGLRFAEAQDYGMLILDVVLPKLDGLSLMRELRQR